ncbi:WXG100 family type VII secretion target [Nonomuraea cavernae]|uniref:WXG100 family type VII secretion target n=1 Tax=Nonomuraea cavernae TaxID=2045107 RepID=UPI0033D44895
MGSERKVLVIRSFEATPQGETVKAPRKEIERLLTNTKPGEIDDAGSAYQNASKAVDRAVNALTEHAGQLAKVWKGPTAAQVQKAMQLMHASGLELSSKLKQMDEALGSYAKQLPVTLSKVQSIATPAPPPDVEGTSQAQANVEAQYLQKKAAEDAAAQKAMRELNEKIVEILEVSVPMTVSYELPTVAIPGEGGGPGQQQSVVLSNLSANSGDTGSPGSGDQLSPGSDGGNNGSSGSDPNSNPSDSNPNGSNPNGTDPTGTNGGDPNGTGSNTTDPNVTEGTGSDPLSTQRQTGLTDGTVPSVLGKEDPRLTEVANFSPQTTTASPFTSTPFTGTPTGSPYTGAPFTGTPNATTLTPVTTGNSPGVPSVLGGPGTIGGAPGGGPAGSARSLGVGTGMMPFMPMGGMGLGTSGEGTEVGTNLTEERDIWTTVHTVTEPRIG